jgi:hypothetical protein
MKLPFCLCVYKFVCLTVIRPQLGNVPTATEQWSDTSHFRGVDVLLKESKRLALPRTSCLIRYAPEIRTL